MRGHRADVAADGHAVVVENDDHRFPGRTRVIQSLVGKTAGKRTVPDERENGIILVQQRSRLRHTERHGDGVGGMSGNKRVMHALVRLGKARNAAVTAERGKPVLSPRQDLMHITLMPDVKNKAIPLRVKHAMDRHRQLHSAQIGRKVPSGARNMLHEKLPQFAAQLFCFLRAERLDVIRVLYLFQYQFACPLFSLCEVQP